MLKRTTVFFLTIILGIGFFNLGMTQEDQRKGETSPTDLTEEQIRAAQERLQDQNDKPSFNFQRPQPELQTQISLPTVKGSFYSIYATLTRYPFPCWENPLQKSSAFALKCGMDVGTHGAKVGLDKIRSFAEYFKCSKQGYTGFELLGQANGYSFIGVYADFREAGCVFDPGRMEGVVKLPNLLQTSGTNYNDQLLEACKPPSGTSQVLVNTCDMLFVNATTREMFKREWPYPQR